MTPAVRSRQISDHKVCQWFGSISVVADGRAFYFGCCRRVIEVLDFCRRVVFLLVVWRRILEQQQFSGRKSCWWLGPFWDDSKKLFTSTVLIGQEHH